MKRKIIISIVVILSFVALRYLKYLYAYCIFGKEVWDSMDFHLKVSILNYSIIFVVFAVTILRRRPNVNYSSRGNRRGTNCLPRVPASCRHRGDVPGAGGT